MQAEGMNKRRIDAGKQCVNEGSEEQREEGMNLRPF